MLILKAEKADSINVVNVRVRSRRGVRVLIVVAAPKPLSNFYLTFFPNLKSPLLTTELPQKATGAAIKAH